MVDETLDDGPRLPGACRGHGAATAGALSCAVGLQNRERVKEQTVSHYQNLTVIINAGFHPYNQQPLFTDKQGTQITDHL